VSNPPPLPSAAPYGARPAAPAPRVVVPHERPHLSRERLGRTLALLAAAAFALGALVAPGDLAASHAAERWGQLVVALAQGVVLGALVGISHRHRRTAARAAAVAAALTAAIVLLRHAPADVGAGWREAAALAAFSAAACGWAAGQGGRIAHGASASASASHVLALDYPLVGLVWLTTPVLWLLSTSATAASGAAAAACAGLFGGSLLASVRASRGPAAGGGTAGTVGAVAAWTAAGMAPLLAREPAATLVLVALVTIVAGATAPWLGPTVFERRFEQRALVRALPALAAAAFLVVVAPAGGAAGPDALAAAALAAPPADGALGAYVGLALVAGYAGAELRGRLEERSGRLWRGVAWYAVPLAAAAEAVRCSAGAGQPNLWRALAAVGAARLGTALYHAYRRHARALAAAGRTRHRVADAAGWPRRDARPRRPG
jgi:hypothetical protein